MLIPLCVLHYLLLYQIPAPIARGFGKKCRVFIFISFNVGRGLAPAVLFEQNALKAAGASPCPTKDFYSAEKWKRKVIDIRFF